MTEFYQTNTLMPDTKHRVAWGIQPFARLLVVVSSVVLCVMLVASACKKPDDGTGKEPPVTIQDTTLAWRGIDGLQKVINQTYNFAKTEDFKNYNIHYTGELDGGGTPPDPMVRDLTMAADEMYNHIISLNKNRITSSGNIKLAEQDADLRDMWTKRGYTVIIIPDGHLKDTLITVPVSAKAGIESTRQGVLNWVNNPNKVKYNYKIVGEPKDDFTEVDENGAHFWATGLKDISQLDQAFSGGGYPIKFKRLFSEDSITLSGIDYKPSSLEPIIIPQDVIIWWSFAAGSNNCNGDRDGFKDALSEHRIDSIRNLPTTKTMTSRVSCNIGDGVPPAIAIPQFISVATAAAGKGVQFGPSIDTIGIGGSFPEGVDPEAINRARQEFKVVFLNWSEIGSK